MEELNTRQSNDADKKPHDWETIEKDWRAGIKTKLQMSQEYGISRAAIDKHFDKLGIERDLTEKIKQRADALVTQAAVAEVTREVTQKRLVTTEKEIVEVNARNQADLILAHRKDIPRYQKLAASIMSELEAQTGNKELFDQLGKLLQEADEKGMDKLNEIYRKVIATPQRVDSFKKLTETYKILIGLERQAFGISDNANGDADKPPIRTINPEILTIEQQRAIASIAING